MDEMICDVCKEPFIPTHHAQKRHPGECTRIYDRRAAKARWHRRQAALRTWHPEPQKCEYCPKVFTPRVKGQVTCGSEECKQKHKTIRARILSAAWRQAEKDRAQQEAMACPFDDMDFLPQGCRSFREAQMMPV